jgi:hypothetical protein
MELFKIYKISPDPSFPKRGKMDFCQRGRKKKGPFAEKRGRKDRNDTFDYPKGHSILSEVFTISSQPGSVFCHTRCSALNR